MKSLKICKTRKEDQIVPPTARSKCIGAFQIRKELPLNSAVLISWGYFDQVPYRYKFYNCDCSKTKIIKLNHLFLHDIQTDHIETVFQKYSQTFISFYGLSNEDLNMKDKKARTLMYFLFLIFYFRYILVGIQPSNVKGLGTIPTNQGLSTNNFHHA